MSQLTGGGFDDALKEFAEATANALLAGRLVGTLAPWFPQVVKRPTGGASK